MGKKQNQPFQLSFNASRKVDFQGSRVTSDGGLILVRELDERLGLGELIERHLTDSRRVFTTPPDLHEQRILAVLFPFVPNLGLSCSGEQKATAGAGKKSVHSCPPRRRNPRAGVSEAVGREKCVQPRE